MDVDGVFFYLEFVFLSVVTCVKATQISVDGDHCGGNISVDVNDSVFLNYYGADLKENASDKYLISEKKCIFKISASRSNYEICIRNKDKGRISVYQLRKCYLAFKYYMGSYGPYSGNQIYCIHFDDDPLCTTVDTVYAVFKYYSYVSYKKVWLEFEIYLRKPPAKRGKGVAQHNQSSGQSLITEITPNDSITKLYFTAINTFGQDGELYSGNSVISYSKEQEETWTSSWSDSDTSDDSEGGVKLGWIILLAAVGFFMLIFCICCCNDSSDKPYGSPNTQNTEPEGLRDNPFRNVQSDAHATSIVNRYRTEGPPAEASEDRWKPPEYQSVDLIDQSFYGDSKPCKVYVLKETGPDSIEDLDDPPPPYPGV